MRRYSKYKNYSKLNKVVFYYPQKLSKLKHTKWKNINSIKDLYAQRDFFVNHSSQNIPDTIRRKADFYHDMLDIRREISQIYDSILKISSFKNLILVTKKKHKNNFIDVLIESLIKFEFRLDVLLFRAGFFSTIYEAKDFINHGYITVNGNLKNYNYITKEGDIIEFKKFKKIDESNITPCFFQSFLEIDYSYLTIFVTKNYRDLTLEDISLISSEKSSALNQISSLYYNI
jgi:ribosomal protein S4